MYDLAEVRAATDAWWGGIARHLRAAGIDSAPGRLCRGVGPDWSDPQLLFSQTCGYPLTHRLAGRVRLLSTPCYRAPGCDGPRYCSVLLVPAASDTSGLADLRGQVCAINDPESHSGMNALRRMIAPLAGGRPFFGRVVCSGSHPASIAAVAAGRAQLCAVDAVLHALLARHRPGALAGTRTLGFSPTAPGLPYIAGPTVPPADVARMQQALDAALADPRLAGAREALLLAGGEALPSAAYDEILRIEAEAEQLGYPQLR